MSSLSLSFLIYLGVFLSTRTLIRIRYSHACERQFWKLPVLHVSLATVFGLPFISSVFLRTLHRAQHLIMACFQDHLSQLLVGAGTAQGNKRASPRGAPSLTQGPGVDTVVQF